MVFVFCLDWRGETRMCHEKYLMIQMQPVWFLFAAIPGHHASQDGREALERHEENADTEVQIKILILNFILFHLLFIIDVFYPPHVLALGSFWLSSLSAHVISSVSRKDRPFIEQYFLGLDNKPKPKVCKGRTSRTIELIRNSINTKWGVKLGYLTR